MRKLSRGGFPSLVKKCPCLLNTHKFGKVRMVQISVVLCTKLSKECEQQPGDSAAVTHLFIPKRWVGHDSNLPTFELKVGSRLTLHHPKKGTKNCQEFFGGTGVSPNGGGVLTRSTPQGWPKVEPWPNEWSRRSLKANIRKDLENQLLLI